MKLDVDSKEFYMWAYDVVKTTYEFWGIDMMYNFDKIKEYFPNTANAIICSYKGFEARDYCRAESLEFKNPNEVYEAIMNILPKENILRFNLRTKEQLNEFKYDNMSSWDDYLSIHKISLVAAIFMFTEEFIFEPLFEKNIFYSLNKLTVYGNFVTFKISKRIEKTYVSILIRDYMLLEYVILN